jgi:hypothetical protein
MTRYKVRVELIEVITDEETGNVSENVIDAANGIHWRSLTETQELFYKAIGAAC